jgi:tRNA G18 (ribose-2'-O)-methylase SpoU
VKTLRVSRRNSTFQVLQALKTNRAKRNELDEVFVEGIAAIKGAVLAGRTIRKLVYTDYDGLSEWGRRLVAGSGDAQCIALDRDLYGELCDRNEPSEILATVGRESLALERVRLPRNPFVVVVDRPGNHGNLGSLVRSADAFGVDLLVTLGHAVDLYDPVVIRASMGGIFFLPVCHEQSTKTLGGWIGRIRATCPRLAVVGTDSKGDVSLPEDEAVSRPVILVVGNEAKGLSVELRTMVDRMVRIPMQGRVDSLNVACAASIAMYEIARRSGDRRGFRPPPATAHTP